jgi:hypothetical protein
MFHPYLMAAAAQANAAVSSTVNHSFFIFLQSFKIYS